MSETDQSPKIGSIETSDQLPDREKMGAERTPILDIVFGNSVERIIQDSIKAGEKFSDGGRSAEILYGPMFTEGQKSQLESLLGRKVGKRALVKISRLMVPARLTTDTMSESFCAVLIDQLMSVQPLIRDFACATSRPILTPDGKSAFLIEETPAEIQTHPLESYDVNALLYQLAFLKFQMHKLGLGSPDSLTKEWVCLFEGELPRIVCYDLGFINFFPKVGSIHNGSDPSIVADKARAILIDIFHFKEALQKHFLPRFPGKTRGALGIIENIDQTLSTKGIADLWTKRETDETFLSMIDFDNILIKIPGLSANERVLEKVFGRLWLVKALNQDAKAAILTFQDVATIKTETLEEMKKQGSKNTNYDEMNWISRAVIEKKLEEESISNGYGRLAYLKHLLLQRGLLTGATADIGAWAKIPTIDN